MRHLLCTLIFIGFSFGQEAKVKLHALDIGIGLFNNELVYIKDYSESLIGLNADFNLSLKYRKHLLNIGYCGGEELAFFGKPSYNYHFLKAQYGRRLDATNCLKLEGFAGLGLYHQSRRFGFNYGSRTELSLPISIKTIFLFKQSKGMSINTHYNIGKYDNIFSMNVGYYYQFN